MKWGRKVHTYIALLKGINVGGRNLIKMAELRLLFEAIDLGPVQTYIQSGNVLFRSSEDEEPLRIFLEQQIKREFGFFVPVVLRTSAQMEEVTHNSPFSQEEVAEAESNKAGESVYVAFLNQVPSSESIERIRNYQSETEKYQIIGSEVYLLFSTSIRNSKLANNLLKLDASITVRNWKTVNKLVALAKTMAL